MKMTDALFSKLFQEIGAEYPDIIQHRYIIDIGSPVWRPVQSFLM